MGSAQACLATVPQTSGSTGSRSSPPDLIAAVDRGHRLGLEFLVIRALQLPIVRQIVLLVVPCTKVQSTITKYKYYF
jgi:hypothetical protein